MDDNIYNTSNTSGRTIVNNVYGTYTVDNQAWASINPIDERLQVVHDKEFGMSVSTRSCTLSSLAVCRSRGARLVVSP